jgi:hypothetical protein
MDKLKINVDKLLADINLIVCSPLAQGVFFRLMLVFHKSVEYGGVFIDGAPHGEGSLSSEKLKKLSAMCGMDACDVHNGVSELIKSNVLRCEYSDSGAFLFDPRMVSARKVSKIRSEIGKKGGGNPNIKPTPKAIELTLVSEPYSKEVQTTKPKQIPKPEKSTYTDVEFIKELVALGADEELARLWSVIRKKDKAVNSTVFVRNIPKKLSKAGIGINEALEVIVDRSWVGLEAHWFTNLNTPFAQRNADRKKQETTRLDPNKFSKASNL